MKLAALAAILLLLAPTTASAVEITKLGAGPILTPSNTRAALVDKIRASERFATAEKDLGLNAVQIRQFNERLPKATYVILPRHLDRMAYYSNGIKILRDVTIPAETKGWTLDVSGAHIFIPQTCSNISVVFVRGKVAATIAHAPLVVVASPAAIPTPSPTPTATPIPALPASPEVAPVIHHTSGWLGLLLLPLFFIHSGGDTSSPSLSPPVYAPTPTHKPTSTPTPLPTPTPVPTKTPCPTPTPTPTKTPCPTPTPCPTKTK